LVLQKEHSIKDQEVITSELKIEIKSRLTTDQTRDQEISLSIRDLWFDEGKTTREDKPVLLTSSIRTKKSLPKDKSILIRYFIPHPTNANDGFHFLFLIHSEVEVPESHPNFSPTIDTPTRFLQRKNKQS